MSTSVPLVDAVNTAAVGGKAANLARLIAAGAPVPDGVVIPDSTERRDDVGEQDLVPLLSSTLIVRSSAIGEDSADASFAGQLESVGNVTGIDELRTAISRVRASQYSDRVLAYQASRQKNLQGMGVIVQRQIDAVLSGVLFTVSPTNPDQMLVEYCAGLGEALVSGAVNPGRIVIDRPSEAGLYRWAQLAAPDEVALEAALLLNDRKIAELAELALHIERTFACPQDIEWTIDRKSKLWIVQSRPITAIAASPIHRTDPPTYRATDPPGHVVWSNANVNENFPQPISPLLYSIARAGYYHYFRNLGVAFGISARRLRQMEAPLRQIIGVHGARMYYNLTSIHSVLRSAPFGDLLARSFNQFVGAEETAAPRVGAAYRVRQAFELALIAAQTTWQYLFLTRRVRQFESTVDAYAAHTHPDELKNKGLPQLLADFREFLDIRCHRWKNASLADTASMVCYGALQRLLARNFPGADQHSLHNSLLKALPDLVSGIPALKLWDLSRMIRANSELHALVRDESAASALAAIASDPKFADFHRAFQDFLEHWGFRCSAELMLTVPSFQEDAAPLIEILKAYAAMDGDSPADLLEKQARERIAQTSAVMSALSWHRALLVSVVLRWTQRSIQLRERARLKQALLYSRLRRVTLAIGDRLVNAGRLSCRNDVFFLTAEELESLLAGSEMFPDHVMATVALRRSAHGELSAMTPPDSLRLPAGEYLRVQSSQQTQKASGVPSRSLTGVGACGGTAAAPAAILLDVTEAHKLSAGDVLVTRQTDPGWGPIFPLISGLVIERGGMLSHGAIIAREFGIPSVVGVKDATRLIPHGAHVIVDGNVGSVRVSERQDHNLLGAA
jgi:pyruvate,water dikinase